MSSIPNNIYQICVRQSIRCKNENVYQRNTSGYSMASEQRWSLCCLTNQFTLLPIFLEYFSNKVLTTDRSFTPHLYSTTKKYTKWTDEVPDSLENLIRMRSFSVKLYLVIEFFSIHMLEPYDNTEDVMRNDTLRLEFHALIKLTLDWRCIVCYSTGTDVGNA